MSYIMSSEIEVFVGLTIARMERGDPTVLLLNGPPGAGKTSLAQEVARRLDASLAFHSCAPDQDRNLLYEIDVTGVIQRTKAWVPGPAWRAFEQSAVGPAVLLIDEVDKASSSFDAFLLRLLQELRFLGPEGVEISADPRRLLIVLTSNGRRELRPEVLRRCQRLVVPRPSRDRMKQILKELAPGSPPGLIDLLVRLGEMLASGSRAEPELAPSPVELARCADDLMVLARIEGGRAHVRVVVESHLIKDGGPSLNDSRGGPKFDWPKALWGEAKR